MSRPDLIGRQAAPQTSHQQTTVVDATAYPGLREISASDAADNANNGMIPHMVQCPPHIGPGEEMIVQTEAGLVRTRVPDGVARGGSFMVQLQPEESVFFPGSRAAGTSLDQAAASQAPGVTWQVSFDWPAGARAAQQRVIGTQAARRFFGGGSSSTASSTSELELHFGVALVEGVDGMATIASVRDGAVAAQQVAVGDRIVTVNGTPTPWRDLRGVERMLLDAMETRRKT